MGKETPLELRRLSTEFVPVEDRIRLSAEDDLGNKVTLWLTQRLLLRLLPSILRWIERLESERLGAPGLQGFRQQAARAGLASQPTVRADERSSAWLVRAIDFSPGAKTMRLNFRGGTDQHARLALAVLPARQWLNIVHDAWRRAGWSMEVWPAWMQEARPTEQPPRPPVLH